MKLLDNTAPAHVVPVEDKGNTCTVTVKSSPENVQNLRDALTQVAVVSKSAANQLKGVVHSTNNAVSSVMSNLDKMEEDSNAI